MGDNFLRQKVSNAKRRRDRAAVDLKRPGLFARPELVQTTYPVSPVDGHEFSVGDLLYGVASRKGRRIEVTDGSRKLGFSEGDSAKALRDELSKPGGLTAIRMKVCEVGALLGSSPGPDRRRRGGPMSKQARLREELRPHGVPAPGCPGCVWFEWCGGFEPERTLYNIDCFQMTCCNFTGDAAQVEKCGLACPHNPRFLELLQDINGMDTEHLTPLVQADVSATAVRPADPPPVQPQRTAQLASCRPGHLSGLQAE